VCLTVANSSGFSCTSPSSAYTTTFGYNGDGLRMSDVPAGGTTQEFTWDVSSSTPNLLEDGSDYYLYGPSDSTAPIEQISISSATPSWLVSDSTGVREQINNTGSVICSMNYDTYGNRCSTCSISTSFGFEGGYSDATGLVYLINRYYDPSTDQFLSIDPDVATTDQPYAFTNDEPLNAEDPLGEDPPLLCNPNGCPDQTLPIVTAFNAAAAGQGEAILALQNTVVHTLQTISFDAANVGVAADVANLLELASVDGIPAELVSVPVTEIANTISTDTGCLADFVNGDSPRQFLETCGVSEAINLASSSFVSSAAIRERAEFVGDAQTGITDLRKIAKEMRNFGIS
jgi:RHS repeat-associated protein